MCPLLLVATAVLNMRERRHHVLLWLVEVLAYGGLFTAVSGAAASSCDWHMASSGLPPQQVTPLASGYQNPAGYAQCKASSAR